MKELRAKGLDVTKPQVAPYGMKQMCCVIRMGMGFGFQWEAKAGAAK